MSLNLMVTEPGMRRTRSVGFNQALIKVGRATSCDLVIEGDKEVSRLQFEITFGVSPESDDPMKERIWDKTKCSWFFTDRSSQGTVVKRNGSIVSAKTGVPVRLEVNDEIQFGTFKEKKWVTVKVLSC